MSIWTVKAPKQDYENEVPPAGSHPAVLVGLIDLGTQKSDYQGDTRHLRRIFLVWELTAEKKAGSTNNFVVGKDFTLSFGKKAALRGLVEKWRGRVFTEEEQFDLTKLLGARCLLTLVHKTSNSDRTYAKIDGVAPVPKGMTVPPAQHTPLMWAIAQGARIPDQDWIPYVYGESISDVIERSPEWKGEPVPTGGASEIPEGDDVPF